MTENRANWYEIFESCVQFYPKLSAAIAIETMAAAGRMISSSRAVGDTAATLVETKPSIPLSPPHHTKKRAISRQSSNVRKTSKRGTGRRKAKTSSAGRNGQARHRTAQSRVNFPAAGCRGGRCLLFFLHISSVMSGMPTLRFVRKSRSFKSGLPRIPGEPLEPFTCQQINELQRPAAPCGIRSMANPLD